MTNSTEIIDYFLSFLEKRHSKCMEIYSKLQLLSVEIVRVNVLLKLRDNADSIQFNFSTDQSDFVHVAVEYIRFTFQNFFPTFRDILVRLSKQKSFRLSDSTP